MNSIFPFIFVLVFGLCFAKEYTDADLKNVILEQDRRGSEFTDDNSSAETQDGKAAKRGIFLGKGSPHGTYGGGYHGGGAGFYGGGPKPYYPSGIGTSDLGHSLPSNAGGHYGPSGVGYLPPSGHGGPYGPSGAGPGPSYPPTGHGLEHGGGHAHGYGLDHKALAWKGILIPLAGIALLGAAAALSTNPVLLQLGVLNGRRRRRSVKRQLDFGETYPSNPFVKPTNSYK